MKYIFLFLTIAQTASAQRDSTKSFDVDGIKVIYRYIPKQLVEVSLFFRGGTSNYPPGKAGLESLAINGAIDCGSSQFSANAFKDKSEYLGLQITSNAQLDYSRISLNCLSKYFDEGWNMFQDAITKPAFEETAFEIRKKRQINSSKLSDNNPDSRLRRLALKNAFAMTAYAVEPEGTDSTLEGISASEARAYYYDKLLNRSKMFLVVVGNISREAITAKIKESFGSVKLNGYQPNLTLVAPFDHNTLNVEQRTVATNYIMGVMNAPAYTSAEYVPFLLSMWELQGMIFHEVRQVRNLSYAPQAGLVNGLIPYSFIYVSTNYPKDAVRAINQEISESRNSKIETRSLEEIKALYITVNYIGEQSAYAIAGRLGQSEILGGWEYSEKIPELIKQTTRKEMIRALRKYLSGINWTYLGDQAKAQDAKSAFEFNVN